MKKRINFVKLFFLAFFLSNSFVATNLFSMKRKQKGKDGTFEKKQKTIENLTCLPEIWLKILGYLEPKDFSFWARTCKYFNAIFDLARIRELNLGKITMSYVAWHGKVDWVKKFIKDIETKKEVNEGIRKLVRNAFLCGCKHLEVLKCFLQSKRVLELLNEQTVFITTNILCWSFCDSSLEKLKTLLKNEIILNLLNERCVNNILVGASRCGHLDIVKFLLENEIVSGLVNKKGIGNAFAWANEWNSVALKKILKDFLAQKQKSKKTKKDEMEIS